MQQDTETKEVETKPLTTKEQIKKLIEQGDKRSYNEIAADLELAKWKQRFK